MLDNNNVKLFREAISEGLNNRIQSVIDSCPENTIPSLRHRRAMATLLRQSKEQGSALTPKMRRVIAVLVAAALLLASCAIVYRKEIRGFIENIYESFIKVSYTEGDYPNIEPEIKEFYELTYLPEGYNSVNTVTTNSLLKSVFSNTKNKIVFEQRVLDYADFYLDVEEGYTKIVDIKNHEVYYRNTSYANYYHWNDGKYSMRLISDFELSTDELQQIIDGVKTK